MIYPALIYLISCFEFVYNLTSKTSHGNAFLMQVKCYVKKYLLSDNFGGIQLNYCV